MNAADKKHNKFGKMPKIVHQFKSIKSELLDCIIADTHWELVCNDKFHLSIFRVYIINHWHVKDKSCPLVLMEKSSSPILSSPPPFFRTITFILIKFCIMYGYTWHVWLHMASTIQKQYGVHDNPSEWQLHAWLLQAFPIVLHWQMMTSMRARGVAGPLAMRGGGTHTTPEVCWSAGFQNMTW